MLTLDKLSCERDERELFRELSCTLHAGRTLQILGPNGSGKTTLLRMIATLYHIQQGRILWQGQAIEVGDADYLQDIIYIGHTAGLKLAMTALENLRFMEILAGRTHPHTALIKALIQVNLQDFADIPTDQLSQGQQRKIALARLCLADVPLWILDEPLTALDVGTVRWLETLIDQHNAAGGLAILTSHQPLRLQALQTLALATQGGMHAEIY